MNAERRYWFGPFESAVEASTKAHEHERYVVVIDFADRCFAVPLERVDEFVDFARHREQIDSGTLKGASLWVQ
jgi:hypothetical protein